MFKLEGLYTAMLTPFDEQGKINETVLREMVDFQIERGVTGMFPVATTSEFVHLSMEETKRAIDIVVDQVSGRVPVVSGVSSSSLDDAIEKARYAESKGCDAVLACSPYFFTISQEAIFTFFEKLADSVNVPLIVYNIPAFTTGLTYETVGMLSNHPNIIGLKDSGGGYVDFMNTLSVVDDEFSIMLGFGHGMVPGLTTGINGIMDVVPNIIPEVSSAIFNEVKGGDMDKAKKLQLASLKFTQLCASMRFPIGFKAAMEVRGFDMGPAKLPLTPSEEARVETLKVELEDCISDLLDMVN